MSDKELEKVLDMAEEMQKEMHRFIEMIAKTERGRKLTYDAMQTTFFFIKIAELQQIINNPKP